MYVCWVDDRPDWMSRSAVYVVGGKEFPAELLLLCPKFGCEHKIYLDVLRGKWSFEVSPGGLLSVSPSVKMPGCGAHFSIRDGRLKWHRAAS